MNLNDISFPIYLLGKRTPITEEGVTFYLNKTEEEGKIVYFPHIIDDKNIPGDTLGKRRLAIELRGDKLQKIKYSAYFIADLLKLTRGSTWFIDNYGKIFKYVKSKRVPLIFKKISNITPMYSGGAIIEVENIPTRFKVLYTPQPEHKTAGLLVIGNSYILYGLYDKLYDKTVRMI